MSEQNPPTTWRSDTEGFAAAASWLGDAFKPQLRALYAYADALDRAEAAGEVTPPSLVAEYARLHRWLINRSGGSTVPDEPEPTGPTLFDLLGGKLA